MEVLAVMGDQQGDGDGSSLEGPLADSPSDVTRLGDGRGADYWSRQRGAGFAGDLLGNGWVSSADRLSGDGFWD